MNDANKQYKIHSDSISQILTEIDRVNKEQDKYGGENPLHNLLLCIALCHNGRINGEDKKTFICYSEDERCLLMYAK